MKYLRFFEAKDDLENEHILTSLKTYLKEVDKKWNYITPLDLKKDLDKDPDRYFLLDIRKQEDFKS